MSRTYGMRQPRRLRLFSTRICLFIALVPAIFATQSIAISRPPIAGLEALNLAQDIRAWRTPPSLDVPAWEDRALGYRVIIMVDKARQGSSPTAQTMNVYVLNEQSGQWQRWNSTPWLVSTGREAGGRGHNQAHTRTGFYRAESLILNYKAGTGELMPFSIFYDERWGTAIHQTTQTRYASLGRRASAGCTRLRGDQARALYELVQSLGRGPVVELVPSTGLPNFTEEIFETVTFSDGRFLERVLSTYQRTTPRVIQSWRAMIINTDSSREDRRDLHLQPSDYTANPQALWTIIPEWRPSS